MGSHTELSLECKPHSYSMLLKSFGEQNDQRQKLEEYLACLEEERIKIDAFRRELPLSMHLLTNALEISRQQLQGYGVNVGQKPLEEEFIPLKNLDSKCSDKAPNSSDMADWMTSAQLWSHSDANKIQPISKKDTDIGVSVGPKLAINGGGAFLPFSRDKNSCSTKTLQENLPDLTLNSVNRDMEDGNSGHANNPGKISNMNEQGRCAGHAAEGQTTSTSATQQPHRKARRCWSPDLHRKFVNALQMLGGPQVATPKQIRELMKVEGLTNDEVKSHLQKYRLHTRRSPHAAGAPSPQLVVLSGLWVPPEYATAANHGSATIYGAPQAMPQYCGPAVGQEFFDATPSIPPPNAPHHLFHRQIPVYKAASQPRSSPDFDLEEGKETSESIEEGKSDRSSWKEDSGENGGQRTRVSVRREDSEESNRSEVTLKF